MADIYDDDYSPGQDDEKEDKSTEPEVKLATSEEYAADFEDLEDKAQKNGLVENRKEIKEDKEDSFEYDDNTNPFVKKFQHFFDKYYKTKLEKLIQEYPTKKSFQVDFTLIEIYDPGLADQLVESPDYVIEAMQMAAKKYKSSLIADYKEKEFDPTIRIGNLPKDKRILIKNVSSRHIGKFISIEGLVKQFTTVMPKIKIAHWICKKCGQEVKLHQEGLDIKKPKMCPECKHRDFILDEKNSEFQDYQKLEVQDLLEELKGGEQSSTIQIYVYGDLVNTFTAGERLMISGVLKLRTPNDLKNTVFGQYINCSSIESSKQDYDTIEISKEDEARIKEFSKNPDIYNLLIDSIAPHINGHNEVKEAIILQLFGGVRKILQQKSKIRGNIHVLLIGDPGVGKCLHPDSKIILSNGESRTIEDLFDSTNTTQNKKDPTQYRINKKFEIFALDLNGNIIKVKPDCFWKRTPKEKILEIKTFSGNTLKVTENHPLFIHENGFVKEKMAGLLEYGDYIATANKLNILAKETYFLDKKVTPDLARFFGYVIGDGYINLTRPTGIINLTNIKKEVISDFSAIVKKEFDYNVKQYTKKGTDALRLELYNKSLVMKIKQNYPYLLNKSDSKIIPDFILNSKENIYSEFLKGLFECDSYFDKTNKIIYTSKSKDLIEGIKTLLLRKQIISIIREKYKYATNTKNKTKQKYFDLIISGDDAKVFSKEIGFVTKNRNIANEKTNTNFKVVPNIGKLFKTLRLQNNLKYTDLNLPLGTYKHIEKEDRLPSYIVAKKIIRQFKQLNIKDDLLKRLDIIVNSNIFWDRIVSIKEIDSPKYVYDLQIPKYHNFLADFTIVHNSQVLLSAAQIAPKSIYIAGKTASGAGLCVGRDSLVLKNNKIMKIKDLIEEQLKLGYRLDKDKNLIAKAQGLENTKSYNLNKDQVIDSKILNYVKIPVNNDLIKIIDENGIELITTQNTPVLIDINGEKEYIKASKLKNGDNLVCIKKLDINSCTFDLIKFLDLSNSKIKLTKVKVKEIEKAIKQNYVDKRTFCKNENLLYFGLNHRGIPFVKLDLLLNTLKLKLETKDIESIFNSHGKPIKVPKINEDFMYLFGLVLGDGDISCSKERGTIRISNSDLNILNKAKKIISSLFGKDIEIEYQKDKVPTIRFNSKVIADLFCKLGYITPKVSMTINPELTSLSDKYIANLVKGIFDTDGYIVNRTTHGSNYIGLSSISKDLIYVINLLLKRFGIISHINLKHRTGKVNYINNKVVKSNYDQYELIIYSKENHELFKKYIGFESKPKQASLIEIIKKNAKKYKKNNDETYLSKIVSITKCKDKFVYDFTIDKHHNFFANGFLVHNTATAVKDEFGEGGWTLKAGALVLANGGFAMIDEFDKMDPEDRSAMHEALEQETVSIAKAGIVTSFKTETSVLAAANPKYGRFDAYKTIPEQIDIPPTLMSRFDLFFVLQDVVDEKKDTETVNSILRTHKSGELMHKGTSENLSDRETATLDKITNTAAIDGDFLKKYIAYGRTRVFPILTENAIKVIQKFFIGLRQKSQGGRVTVTFRQLEALVRLAEASAKIRLSENVAEDDANRAISLYKRSMEQVGLDPETGTFDIDIIATGQSHNQTSRMMKIVEIINNLVKEQNGQAAKYEHIVQEAEKDGLDKPKVKELIDKLLKVGDIYEPRAYCYMATKKD